MSEVLETDNLHELLQKVDFENHVVKIETDGKHERRILRIYANCLGYKYRYYHEPKFNEVISFKCKICDYACDSVDDLELIDYEYNHCFYKCPKCFETGYSSDHSDEFNKLNFKIWRQSNCFIIGNNLGKYDIELSRQQKLKIKGDKTWKKRIQHIFETWDSKYIIEKI